MKPRVEIIYSSFSSDCGALKSFYFDNYIKG